MESRLIAPVNEGLGRDFSAIKDACVGELGKVSRIALPMVVVSLSQYLLRAVAMMMLGHRGELALSSAAIATSLCNVTGFSFLLGMSSALETLCGQAYGAEQYQKVGTYTYGAVICLFIACLPVCLLWVFTEKLLILIGQDPEMSKEAGIFSIWLIPALFAFAVLQAMVRYLQTQSLIMPMLWCTLATLLLHLPLSWLFIFTLDLGSAGAALAIGFSYWLDAIMVGFYIKFSSTCKKTRAPFSKDVFLTFREFLQFAIPSALMICLEWWNSEIVILLGGLLTNPTLETSVLSICMSIAVMHFLIPSSFGAAGSTRISNELGAGKPEAAKLVLSTLLILTLVEYVIVITILAVFHSIWVTYSVMRRTLFSTLMKCFLLSAFSLPRMVCKPCSLTYCPTGIARGCGWQHIGAIINLGAFYIAGIPISLLLGFVLHLKGKGLWGGFMVGSTLQSLLLAIVAFRTDYHKQAREARERIFKGNVLSDIDEEM